MRSVFDSLWRYPFLQDSLYVGVPVVTLAGDTWKSRISSVMLQSVGLAVRGDVAS
jgi:hypothetical protein